MEQHANSSKVKIIAFGIAAEKMKTNIMYADGIHDIRSLRSWLATQYPALKDLNLSIAINKKIVQESVDISIPENAEIALLPPFSGG